MIVSTTWKHWLKNHEKNEIYSDNFDRVVSIMDTEKLSPEGCFDQIERRFENIILLTLSTENSIISSFYHEKHGNRILGESIMTIGLCGFGEEAFPIKLEINNVLKCTEKEYEVPSWDELMNLKEEKDVAKLKKNTKKKIKSFAYLPPFLTEVLLDLKHHSAKNYLLAFIRTLLIPLKSALKNEDFETIERLKECHDILVFLWAIDHENEAIGRSKSRLITSSNIFKKWAKKTHEENLISEIDQLDQDKIREIILNDADGNENEIVHNLKKLDKGRDRKRLAERVFPAEDIDTEADPDISIPEEISPTSSSNLEMVFHKLGSIIEKSMEKNTQDMDYEKSQKKKAWKELDSNIKTCVLNASSIDGFDKQEKPEDSFLTIISKKSPAKVLTHLYFEMNGFDVLIIQGLATAISRTILLSTPTWKQISNLSPFFVPPRNSKTVNNTNFLKLHVMEQEGRGYDEKDIDSITSQVPQWSFEITGLRKQIKNFTKLCTLLFGKESLLVRNLHSWDKHILDNEQCYDDYKAEHKHFIVCVLNKIHQNVQRHLTNCQRGWSFINWKDINFEDIQRAIVTETFVVEKPNWVKEKENSNYKEKSHTSGNYSNPEPPTKKNRSENGPVFNVDKDPRFKIPDGSVKFGEIFTAKVRKNFDKVIKNEDGDVVCHRYHIKGICNFNCKLKNSHKKLSHQKMSELNEFVKFAFNSHTKLKSSTGSNTSTNTNESG